MSLAGSSELGIGQPVHMEMTYPRVVGLAVLTAGAMLWATHPSLPEVPGAPDVATVDTRSGSQVQADNPVTPVLPCQEWLKKPGIAEKVANVVRVTGKQQIVDRKIAPGATFAVGCGDHLIAAVAVGTSGSAEKISTSTLEYDIASVRKHFTALAVLKLADEGKLDLDEPVSKYLSKSKYNYDQGAKALVTFRMLLEHRSGLRDPNNYDSLLNGSPTPEQLKTKLINYPLARNITPGTSYSYSNIGMNVVYEAASSAAGEPVAEFEKREIFKPLGMNHTGNLPKGGHCAPTSPDVVGNFRNLSKVLVCTPQDRLASALGGVAGHAGFFTTAEDMAKLFGAEVNGGYYHGKQIFSKNVMSSILHPSAEALGTQDASKGLVRGAGTRYNPSYPVTTMKNGKAVTKQVAILSDRMSPLAFGHTGWCGPIAMADPTTGLYSIMLTNPTLHRSIGDEETYSEYEKTTDAFIDAIRS